MLRAQMETSRQMITYLTSQMEEAVGLPEFLPRMPPPAPQGEITLNHINVSNSAIGVLNTGNIETVETAVATLEQTGENEAAKLLAQLAKAVIESDMQPTKKNEAMELIGGIGTEATAPAQERRKAVGLSLLSGLKHPLRALLH
jgi:hypothetical protein